MITFTTRACAAVAENFNDRTERDRRSNALWLMGARTSDVRHILIWNDQRRGAAVLTNWQISKAATPHHSALNCLAYVALIWIAVSAKLHLSVRKMWMVEIRKWAAAMPSIGSFQCKLCEDLDSKQNIGSAVNYLSKEWMIQHFFLGIKYENLFW